jgi:hypothetical protein
MLVEVSVEEMTMNQLVPILADRAPALIAAVGERASYRFFEFFTANIT